MWKALANNQIHVNIINNIMLHQTKSTQDPICMSFYCLCHFYINMKWDKSINIEVLNSSFCKAKRKVERVIVDYKREVAYKNKTAL